MDRYKGENSCKQRAPEAWVTATREKTPQCSQCYKRCGNTCKFATGRKRNHVIQDNSSSPSLGRYRDPGVYLDPRKFCYPCVGDTRNGSRMPPGEPPCNPLTGFSLGNGLPTTQRQTDCYYAYSNGRLGDNFFSGWPIYPKAY